MERLPPPPDYPFRPDDAGKPDEIDKVGGYYAMAPPLPYALPPPPVAPFQMWGHGSPYAHISSVTQSLIQSGMSASPYYQPTPYGAPMSPYYRTSQLPPPPPPLPFVQGQREAAAIAAATQYYYSLLGGSSNMGHDVSALYTLLPTSRPEVDLGLPTSYLPPTPRLERDEGIDESGSVTLLTQSDDSSVSHPTDPLAGVLNAEASKIEPFPAFSYAPAASDAMAEDVTDQKKRPRDEESAPEEPPAKKARVSAEAVDTDAMDVVAEEPGGQGAHILTTISLNDLVINLESSSDNGNGVDEVSAEIVDGDAMEVVEGEIASDDESTVDQGEVPLLEVKEEPAEPSVAPEASDDDSSFDPGESPRKAVRSHKRSASSRSVSSSDKSSSASAAVPPASASITSPPRTEAQEVPPHSLAANYPTLAAEWSPDNYPRTPANTNVSSDEVVKWQCAKETCGCKHEWWVSVRSRVVGHDRPGPAMCRGVVTWRRGGVPNTAKCPWCEGLVACPHSNLTTRYPELVRYWNEEDNKGLIMTNVLYSSHSKYIWRCMPDHRSQHHQCDRPHVWRARPGSDLACPYCKGSKTCLCTSLAANRPELARRYRGTSTQRPTITDANRHKFDASTVSMHSRGLAWWECEVGHLTRRNITTMMNRHANGNSLCTQCASAQELATLPSLRRTSSGGVEEGECSDSEEVIEEGMADAPADAPADTPVTASIVTDISEATGPSVVPTPPPTVTQAVVPTPPQVPDPIADAIAMPPPPPRPRRSPVVVAPVTPSVTGPTTLTRAPPPPRRRDTLAMCTSVTGVAARSTVSPSAPPPPPPILGSATPPIARGARRSLPITIPALTATVVRDSREMNLAEALPDLVEEWSPHNQPLRPIDVSPTSTVTINWECKRAACGCPHRWRAKISERCRLVGGVWLVTQGCPWCTHNRGDSCPHASIAVTHPNVVKRWDYKRNARKIAPQQVNHRSTRLAWWRCTVGGRRCDCEHAWMATIVSQTKLPDFAACPWCTEQLLCPCKDIRKRSPALGDQLDMEADKTASIYSRTLVPWKCTKGHTWSQSPSSRWEDYTLTGKAMCRECGDWEAWHRPGVGVAKQ